MSTIKKEIQCKSVGLMTGKESKVMIKPTEKKGIRFHIGNEEIEANPFNVVSTDHCTVLGNNRVKIMLIEHFMASLAFCGIDSVDVFLDHIEMPILDGSSMCWIELFEEAGIEGREDENFYSIKEPIFYENGKTSLIVIPSEQFHLTYSVNFDHPELRYRFCNFNLNDNRDKVVNARTFGYLKELESLQNMGFANGVTKENTVGLTQTGYTTELRCEFEPIYHKMLDLIGDFYLTGINPLKMKANIVVNQAGHSVHVKVAKILKEKQEK